MGLNSVDPQGLQENPLDVRKCDTKQTLYMELPSDIMKEVKLLYVNFLKLFILF